MPMHFPDTYYVGIRPEKDGHGHNVPLGWPVPDGTDSASQKRKASVNSWATVNTYNYETKERAAKKGTAKVIDNTPVEGFKIVDDISRSRDWFGSGRTVWRIEDPRGFEFEITSGNLGEILRLTSIDRGLINAKCLFARDGAKNALVVENSEEYQKVAAQTQRLKSATGVKLSDVTIGSKCLMTDNTEETYYGKFYCLVQDSEYLEDSTNRGYYGSRYDNSKQLYLVKERYAMMSAHGKIDFVSKPKIAGVITAGTATNEEATKIVNDNLRNVKSYRTLDALYVNKKKFKAEDIKLHMVEKPAADLFRTVKHSSGEIHWIEQLYSGLILTEHKGQTRVLTKAQGSTWETPAKEKHVIYYVYPRDEKNPNSYTNRQADNNSHRGLMRVHYVDSNEKESGYAISYSKDVMAIPNFWDQLRDLVGKVDQDSMAMNLDRFIATQKWYAVEAEINGERFPAFVAKY